jgi:hypothetical protein
MLCIRTIGKMPQGHLRHLQGYCTYHSLRIVEMQIGFKDFQEHYYFKKEPQITLHNETALRLIFLGICFPIFTWYKAPRLL